MHSCSKECEKETVFDACICPLVRSLRNSCGSVVVWFIYMRFVNREHFWRLSQLIWLWRGQVRSWWRLIWSWGLLWSSLVRQILGPGHLEGDWIGLLSSHCNGHWICHRNLSSFGEFSCWNGCRPLCSCSRRRLIRGRGGRLNWSLGRGGGLGVNYIVSKFRDMRNIFVENNVRGVDHIPVLVEQSIDLGALESEESTFHCSNVNLVSLSLSLDDAPLGSNGA